MRKEDEVALSIYFKLRDYYTTLAKDVGEYSNIIGIFFHQIMIYLTNYYLIRDANESYNQSLNFPYLNTGFVNNPYIISSSYFTLKKKENASTNRVDHLKAILKILRINTIAYMVKGFTFNPFLNSGTRLAISGLSIGKSNIIKLAKTVKCELLPDHVHCYLPRKSEQLEFLKNCLLELFAYMKAPESKSLATSFVNFVLPWITEKQPVIEFDFLLAGSLSITPCRVHAANFKSAGKKVIACSHGANPFLDFDEPVVGYAELSYCDFYIDYGQQRSLDCMKYISPLQKEFPKIFHMNSKIVKKLYRTKFIKHRQIYSDTKILYISNGYSGNERYGPFRDYDDNIYREWQKSLLSLNLNISYKVHPTKFSHGQVEAKKLVTGRLEDIVNDYDILIVDYFGTAYAIAAATDKPVIHFNLGLRNMSPSGLADYKKRAFWVDIDMNAEFNKQINDAIKNYNECHNDYTNVFTEKASLNPNNNANLVNIVTHIIHGNI